MLQNSDIGLENAYGFLDASSKLNKRDQRSSSEKTNINADHIGGLVFSNSPIRFMFHNLY